jgi:YqcI/YcgG family
MKNKFFHASPTTVEIVSHLLRVALITAEIMADAPSQFRLIGCAIAATLAIGGVVMLASGAGYFRDDQDRRSDPRQPRPPGQFENLRATTKCPFARVARLVGGSLSGRGGLERRILRLVPSLVRMTRDGRHRRLDGFVVHVPARLGSDLDRFCQTFNRILRILALHDPTGYNCFEADILGEDWQFSFNETRFFVTAFGSFYESNHSRFSGRNDSGFIYFQPEYSFDHHGISSSNPDRERLKKRIRDGFALSGAPYDVGLIRQPIEAYKYVKPLRIGDPPVQWWNCE